MTTRADTWRSELAALHHQAPPGPATDGDLVEQGQVRRVGSGWLVTMAERSVMVPALVGMRYLVELLTHPGEAVPAIILASQADLQADQAAHELLDEQARDTYVARARDLSQELDESEANNDTGRAELLRAQLDALVEEVEQAAGLGNRPRTSANPERARTAVRKAITRVVGAIDRDHPLLAEHLRDSITTGTTCSYRPRPGAAIEWSIHR